MRWSRALVAAIFVLAVAACSSPASSSGPDDNGNGNGGSSNPPASQGAPASQDDGGNGGNGGNAGDADAVFNALIPPNSTELSKTTASGTFFATYSSTDSVESLTNYYQSAIPGTGMEIFSTTNAQGGTAWIFAETEGSSFGGSVSVYPNTDAGGSSVIITVASDS